MIRWSEPVSGAEEYELVKLIDDNVVAEKMFMKMMFADHLLH